MSAPFAFDDSVRPTVASEASGAAPVLGEASVPLSLRASRRFLDKVQRARALLSHVLPYGRLEEVLETALDDLLKTRDPAESRRRSREPGEKPRFPKAPAARRVPAVIRRVVWRRDGGRCAFIAQDGRVCGSSYGLEIDHVVPYAEGGPSWEPDNLRLLCRAHNRHLARLRFPARPPG